MNLEKNRLQWFANVRMTALLFAILGLWILLGQFAHEILSRREVLQGIFPESIFTALRLSGISEPLRSGFFLSWSVVMVLHFLALMRARLKMTQWLTRQREPLILDREQLAREPRSREAEVFYVSFPSMLRKEDALEFFKEWSKPYLKGFTVLEDDAKQIQLGGVSGRFLPLVSWLGHWGGLFLLTGIVLSVFFRFEGVVTLEEGMETRVVQWTSGVVPQSLKPYMAPKGGDSQGLYELPFYLGLAEWENKTSEGWVNFLEDERLLEAQKVSRLKPSVFEGFSIHPVGRRETHQPAMSFLLKDRLGGHVLRLTHLLPKEWYRLPGARVRYEFADLQRKQVVVFLEEGGRLHRGRLFAQKSKEWVEIGGSEARYQVMVEQAEAIEQIDFKIVKDMGFWWIVGSSIVLFLLTVVTMMWPRTEVWMGWLPGSMWVAVQSSKPALSKRQFERRMGSLYQALSRIDPTVELSRPEVLSGSR